MWGQCCEWPGRPGYYGYWLEAQQRAIDWGCGGRALGPAQYMSVEDRQPDESLGPSLEAAGPGEEGLGSSEDLCRASLPLPAPGPTSLLKSAENSISLWNKNFKRVSPF